MSCAATPATWRFPLLRHRTSDLFRRPNTSLPSPKNENKNPFKQLPTYRPWLNPTTADLSLANRKAPTTKKNTNTNHQFQPCMPLLDPNFTTTTQPLRSLSLSLCAPSTSTTRQRARSSLSDNCSARQSTPAAARRSPTAVQVVLTAAPKEGPRGFAEGGWEGHEGS